jgi:hypothetical protein
MPSSRLRWRRRPWTRCTSGRVSNRPTTCFRCAGTARSLPLAGCSPSSLCSADTWWACATACGCSPLSQCTICATTRTAHPRWSQTSTAVSPSLLSDTPRPATARASRPLPGSPPSSYSRGACSLRTHRRGQDRCATPRRRGIPTASQSASAVYITSDAPLGGDRTIISPRLLRPHARFVCGLVWCVCAAEEESPSRAGYNQLLYATAPGHTHPRYRHLHYAIRMAAASVHRRTG